LAIDPKDKAHIGRLVAEAEVLSRGNEHDVVQSPRQRADCVGWLAQAAQVTSALVADPQNIYRQGIETRAMQASSLSIHRQVREAAALLDRMRGDLDSGYLRSQADRVSASTFDDLLEHAQAYPAEGRHEPAGVLAGVVFEDSARRVYRRVVGASDKDINLERVINMLMTSPTGAPLLNGTEGKRAKVAAHVRTKSTHAQWDEFSAADVDATIVFAREFIEKHLA